MTTNDTNGYLPYDDDTFEKNLGYEPAQLGLTPADIEPMARNWVINPPTRA